MPKIPSWLVEIASGFLTVALALLIVAFAWPNWPELPLYPLAIPLSLALSEFYERVFDRNGYSAQDIAERARGIALAWLLIALYGLFLAPEVRSPPDYRGPTDRVASFSIDARGLTDQNSDISLRTANSPPSPQVPYGVPLVRVR